MADNPSDAIRAQCEAVASRLDAQGLKTCHECPEKGWKLRDGLCPDCYEKKEKEMFRVEKAVAPRPVEDRRDIDG